MHFVFGVLLAIQLKEGGNIHKVERTLVSVI